jgi:hypothetical protein
MQQRLDPTFLQLVEEAAARAYNRKAAFRSFLRRCGVPGNMLAACSDQETKRVWLSRILPELEETEAGQIVITALADALIAHSDFPDLANYEDSKIRIEAAKQAVSALAAYKRKQSESHQEEREAIRRRTDSEKARQSTIARQQSLMALRERLDSLSLRVGEQAAGYDFEEWFYDLADFAEVDCRRPYKSGGRQVDGTITVDGTTYLVELRFKKDQMGGPDLDGILSRINTKADNTMGLFVSISGYNSGATKTGSFARTPLLLIDFSHLYHILSGAMTLDDLIRRIRRHGSQTGESFLELARFESP